MIWLPATLLAALLQAWRTAVQQRVRSELSVNGAGLVRYLYGLPVCIALLTIYLAWTDAAPALVHGAFWFYAFAGGLAQILATNLLIMAFGFRNFVTGTAYAKTEAMQGAILATVLLGEHLPLLTWGGIAVGVAGVLLLSTKGARLRISDLTQPAALCGLGAGLLFALTAVLVKAATLVTETPDRVLAALTVLVSAVSLQLIMQGIYIAIREREQWRAAFRTWRISAQVGVLAALGSAFWFTGFATAPVALVRAVGQVEVFFTLAFGRFYLGERGSARETLALLLIGTGVVLALVGSL